MTTKKIIIKKNQYYDSVYLMGIFNKIEELKGIKQTLVMMGTDKNRDLLKSLGFKVEDATLNDLIIAVEADTDIIIEKVVDKIEDYLEERGKDKVKKQYDNLEDTILDNPDANLALISVPGKYAAKEVEKAINAGLNVFIFSDNVPVEDEIKLKKMGIKKDLLVMGPDSGVGSINGIALATGSSLKKGPIGIIAASGSGAQEVSCIIDKYGPGVSQLIGTGGKDLSAKVGGLTMLHAINKLEADTATEVIVLISKLADNEVIRKVLSRADKIKKPTIAVFLGAEDSEYTGYNNIIPAYTLKEAAIAAIEASTGKKVSIDPTEKEMEKIAIEEVSKYAPSQKYLRGLYMGGTFTEEALIILSKNLRSTLYSNIVSSFSTLSPHMNMDGADLLIDMGSEEFTLGRPHPVIDPVSRTNKFEAEADRDDIAVIILDFILSYGVHPDPVGAIADTIVEEREKARANGRHLTVIASVCGTEADPQKRSLQEEKLKKAGAVVVASNADSAILASKILKKIREK